MAPLHPKGTTASAPSSNWLALQKKLPSVSTNKPVHIRKKRRVDHETASPVSTHTIVEETSFMRGTQQPIASTSSSSSTAPVLPTGMKNGESLEMLGKMILGKLEYSSIHQQPGKYLSLDCEMVGVGIDGKESSLARVSLVNYHGAVQLDVFVRQKERVVDYRTQFSGVRPSDMVHATSFEEVQKQVAELLNDRILVGHAVHNDLKALLLSHPYHQTRDTQIYAHRHKLVKTRRPALRHLVKQELSMTIQEGEHSSVTDARATMAIYRLHRKEWDKGHTPIPSSSSANKRERVTSTDGAVEHDDDDDDENEDEKSSGAVTTVVKSKSETSQNRHTEHFPGGGRKGVSSGLSTIVKRKEISSSGKSSNTQWWKELNGGGIKRF